MNTGGVDGLGSVGGEGATCEQVRPREAVGSVNFPLVPVAKEL